MSGRRFIRADEVETTLADRVVNWFDPERGARRLRARANMALAGAYRGARRDRRQTTSWSVPNGTADSDTLPDLPLLRDRSRDLERNEPLAAGAIGNNVSAVVGTGLSLQCTIDAAALGMTTNEAEAWQELVEREFRAWAGDPKACDAAATQHFYALQGLAYRSFLADGDVFALLPLLPNKASPYGLKVHLVDANRVANPPGTTDSAELAGGIRRNAYGAPTHYLIRKPSSTSIHGLSTEYTEVPAFGSLTGRRNVAHVYDKTRPGLTRGVPYLAPVIETLKEISSYTEAELRAAVVSGMFTGFIKSASGGLAVEPNETSATQSAGGEIKMGPGAIVELGPNEEMQFGDPGRPNTAFGQFVDYMCQYVGVALGQPKEVLLKHFTASYSAARAALLDAWRYYISRRELLAMTFCQPIYEAWLEEAVAIGRVPAPGFFDEPAIRAAYCAAEWKGDAPPEIDPLKAVAAAEKRLSLGLSTKTAETTQLTGGDFVTNVARRARERDLEEDAGLLAAPVARNAPASDPEDVGDPDRPDPLDEPETR